MKSPPIFSFRTNNSLRCDLLSVEMGHVFGCLVSRNKKCLGTCIERGEGNCLQGSTKGHRERGDDHWLFLCGL